MHAEFNSYLSRDGGKFIKGGPVEGQNGAKEYFTKTGTTMGTE